MQTPRKRFVGSPGPHSCATRALRAPRDTGRRMGASRHRHRRRALMLAANRGLRRGRVTCLALSPRGCRSGARRAKRTCGLVAQCFEVVRFRQPPSPPTTARGTSAAGPLPEGLGQPAEDMHRRPPFVQLRRFARLETKHWRLSFEIRRRPENSAQPLVHPPSWLCRSVFCLCFLGPLVDCASR